MIPQNGKDKNTAKGKYAPKTGAGNNPKNSGTGTTPKGGQAPISGKVNSPPKKLEPRDERNEARHKAREEQLRKEQEAKEAKKKKRQEDSEDSSDSDIFPNQDSKKSLKKSSKKFRNLSDTEWNKLQEDARKRDARKFAKGLPGALEMLGITPENLESYDNVQEKILEVQRMLLPEGEPSPKRSPDKRGDLTTDTVGKDAQKDTRSAPGSLPTEVERWVTDRLQELTTKLENMLEMIPDGSNVDPMSIPRFSDTVQEYRSLMQQHPKDSLPLGMIQEAEAKKHGKPLTVPQAQVLPITSGPLKPAEDVDSDAEGERRIKARLLAIGAKREAKTRESNPLTFAPSTVQEERDQIKAAVEQSLSQGTKDATWFGNKSQSSRPVIHKESPEEPIDVDAPENQPSLQKGSGKGGRPFQEKSDYFGKQDFPRAKAVQERATDAAAFARIERIENGRSNRKTDQQYLRQVLNICHDDAVYTAREAAREYARERSAMNREYHQGTGE